MRMIQRGVFFLSFALLLTACSSITNLTPSRQARNAAGLYPVEVAWQTREQAIRPASVTPLVLVGLESYAMKPTPLVSNRWETLIPVPLDKNAVRYRFKVDYEVNAIPARRKNSLLSPEYKLEIIEKK